MSSKYTGLKAPVNGKAVTGVKPRILSVPGLDTQVAAKALCLRGSETACFRLCQRVGL